jgi:hypothetical protein
MRIARRACAFDRVPGAPSRDPIIVHARNGDAGK